MGREGEGEKGKEGEGRAGWKGMLAPPFFCLLKQGS